MVQVSNYFVRQTKDGREFVQLELQDPIPVMVQSSQTGSFYMTIRKCKIGTTFDEQLAKSLIGTQMPGTITRTECEPFEFIDESTGQVLTLMHRWSFWPDGATAPMEESVA